jgi:hypothetical protein
VCGDAGDLADVGLHQCLVAVAQRQLRLGMDVHDDAVGTDRDRAARAAYARRCLSVAAHTGVLL